MSMALVTAALGERATPCPDNGSCLIYDGVRVGVIPAVCLDCQDLPYFDIRDNGSKISVFSVGSGSDTDFYIVRSSALASCSPGLAVAGLSVIAPVALHVKACGIKQAVDLAIRAA